MRWLAAGYLFLFHRACWARSNAHFTLLPLLNTRARSTARKKVKQKPAAPSLHAVVVPTPPAAFHCSQEGRGRGWKVKNGSTHGRRFRGSVEHASECRHGKEAAAQWVNAGRRRVRWLFAPVLLSRQLVQMHTRPLQTGVSALQAKKRNAEVRCAAAFSGGAGRVALLRACSGGGISACVCVCVGGAGETKGASKTRNEEFTERPAQQKRLCE